MDNEEFKALYGEDIDTFIENLKLDKVEPKTQEEQLKEQREEHEKKMRWKEEDHQMSLKAIGFVFILLLIIIIGIIVHGG